MRTLLIIFLVFCTIWNADGQTIEKYSIDNGGASVTNGGIQMLYSIGEVNIQEFNTGGIIISEGFIGFDFNSNTLSVSNFEERNMVVYPNPASSFIHIKTNLSLEKIEIYDVYARLVLKTKYNNSIRISKLSKGTYLLKVYSIHKSYSVKIIVQ